MKKRTIASALSILAACLAIGAVPVAAQDVTPAAQETEVVARYRYRIIGVYDMRTGAPIEDVEIVDLLAGNSVKTTSTGTASLLFMPDGGGLVRIRKIGYEVQTVMISISPVDTTPVTMVLNRIVDLPAVVTTAEAPHWSSPGLRGFEDRRLHHATGYFVDNAALRKSGPVPLGIALMEHIPTINITDGRASAMYLWQSHRCGAGGPPDVYMDGVPLAHVPLPTVSGKRPGESGAANPIDLSQFSTENIAGAEYYPTTSSAPVGFGATSGACGVLLLWSRERY